MPAFVALLTMLWLLLAPAARAGCSREIYVPVSPLGLMVTVHKGQPGGAFVEVLQEAGRATGCRFRFEPMPRARQEMLFLARRSDLMLPAQRTDRRDPFGQHVAMLQVRPTLVALRPLSTHVINTTTLLHDSTLRVAVLRGVDNGPAYRELLTQLRQRERLVVEADTVGVLRALREGLADAALMNPVILQGHLLQAEQTDLRELATHLSARALPELDWGTTGFYLALDPLPPSDRQLLAATLSAPTVRARLWRQLRERYPGPLLDAGYRPLPESPGP
ncbi:transporter substrate-binding domain-containing protein [Inhella gelatinilytica]|uniref:Solute-binding protein family 3/N-terminal domain-containing protein n=1 Tax=Inhella gelatinilytica TaxID=2795030 RepID=A0A931NBZ0_9BURK|nr:transporter substrate-binding domain-containing protein [Inhella gelatinilytica]MBH9551432.1 hypothetical protein [Inhella gelatinilytica]